MASPVLNLHPHSKVPSKALLIGINYRAWPANQLRGCHKDVEDAQKFLLDIGMSSDDIRILTDEEEKLAPTKEAILEHLRWVKEDAHDGDVLFVHYSGHGVEEEPPAKNPLNRTSSKAICPIDLFHHNTADMSKNWNFGSSDLRMVNSIQGEDFHDIFGDLSPEINLTVVYDCCHSTGAMRALGSEAPSKQTAVRGIKIPAGHSGESWVQKVSKKVGEIEKIVKTNADGSSSQDLDSSIDPRYVPQELYPDYAIGFAAAQGWEPAADSSADGFPCGAFSHFFYSLLMEDPSTINGSAIIVSVNEALKKNHYSQTASFVASKSRYQVPFFFNLSQTSRGIGMISNNPNYYQKLNSTRSINAPALAPQKFSLSKKEQTPVKPKPVDGKGNGSSYSQPDGHDESDPDKAFRAHVGHMVKLSHNISASPELLKLRQQDRGLFDSLLQHALPFALNAASVVVQHIASSPSRDVADNVNQMLIQQHLPTAINFAQQVACLPEVQEDRGLFDKIFTTCMPIVLSTAQQILAAKRGLETGANAKNDEEAQRGFSDFVVNQVLPSAMNVFATVVGGSNRDIDSAANSDRGFWDVLQKVAPIALNVAQTTIASLSGQRSLSFAPQQYDRGFFDSLKNVVLKVITNPIVKKIGATALNVGIEVASAALASPTGGSRDVRRKPNPDELESSSRGFFGTILQHLVPIAINVVKGAVSGIEGSRDITGKVIPAGDLSNQRGILDFLGGILF